MISDFGFDFNFILRFAQMALTWCSLLNVGNSMWFCIAVNCEWIFQSFCVSLCCCCLYSSFRNWFIYQFNCNEHVEWPESLSLSLSVPVVSYSLCHTTFKMTYDKKSMLVELVNIVRALGCLVSTHGAFWLWLWLRLSHYYYLFGCGPWFRPLCSVTN